MDDDDFLVRRRPRRSTAGNRMEAALAEMSIEEMPDADDDRDFIVEVDEADAFGSDFESTDEEASQSGPETSEKVVADEERRQRKAARSRLEKATAAAAARQRVTFNPSESTTAAEFEREKKRRRVSLGTAVNAETGEPVGPGRRQSGRALTALARTASLARWVEEEKLKSSTPKKAKVKVKSPTQDELLKIALDMEDGNIAAHRDYLANEEEKRRRAHIVRAVVQGPLVRWISRRVVVDISPLEPTSGLAPASIAEPVSEPAPVYASPLIGTLSGSFTAWPHAESKTTATSSTSAGIAPFQPGARPSLYTTLFPPAHPVPTPTPSSVLSTQEPPSLPPLQPPAQWVEAVAQQFVVHELSQDADDRPPAWKDTMTALFGGHVAWDELRVFTAKNRPLSRPIRVCPITGLPAPYRDPRTGVPFATPEAYTVLTKILNHEYVWSPALGCYVTPYEVPEEAGANADGRGTDKEVYKHNSAAEGRRKAR